MTTITASPSTTGSARRAAQLASALLIGLVIGSASTFLLGHGGDAPTIQGAAALAGAPEDIATTDASTQYADWYLRGPLDHSERTIDSTDSSRQDIQSSASPRSLAGSTTASQQYRDWYTRPVHDR
jgi:hypothetical protein